MTQFLTIENETEAKESKKTVLSHEYNNRKGWVLRCNDVDDYIKVVYLGNCSVDGDMFACYTINNHIIINKGIKGDEFNK